MINAMSKSSKAGGCGCGGSGGGCGCGGGGGCGCGGSQTALCVSGEVGCTTSSDQSFARPVFFAGQLLTEEDLQALGDYVVGKNRLHNRHLIGDGVVCGLEVICDPCGGGSVTVQPGYALDCCGNDLLLSCPTELNINAMARDLRRQMLGGHDCGDPCADKKKPQPATPTGKNSGTEITGAVVAPDRGTGEQPGTTATAPLTRHYCLYAHYCEEKTDPVSPYSTDDGCTFQACQPTRVREGIRFELRCRECECHDTDILSRICNCIGDPEGARANAQRAEDLKTLASVYAQQAATAQGNTAVLAPTRTREAALNDFLQTAGVVGDFSLRRGDVEANIRLPQDRVRGEATKAESAETAAQPDAEDQPTAAVDERELDRLINATR
ncbi:MAG TPA: hypothetical protein VGB05_01465, partial [Pyrinomonadaceae bacterium]